MDVKHKKYYWLIYLFVPLFVVAIGVIIFLCVRRKRRFHKIKFFYCFVFFLFNLLDKVKLLMKKLIRFIYCINSLELIIILINHNIEFYFL